MGMPLLMNAAGWAKTAAHVRELARVPTITHVVFGSITREAREGNTGGTNFRMFDDGTSVNSLGLPNHGIEYLREHGPEMVHIVHAADKIFVVSIAGFCPEEYGRLANVAFSIGADIVEVNAGCPNAFIGDASKKKVPLSFEPQLMSETFGWLKRCVGKGKPFWLKVSPYSDPRGCDDLARMVSDHAWWLQAVVACNTFPDASAYIDAKPAIDVADNFAGLAGTALRPIALGQCRKLRRVLPPTVAVIGVGGISAGMHLLEYQRIGCAGGQIGTAFFHGENFRLFEDVTRDFVGLVAA